MAKRINTIKIKEDADTHEVISTSIHTAEQAEGYQKKLRAEAYYEARKHEFRKQVGELGSFTWLIYNSGEALNYGLSSDALVKVIFLSTFMDYDNYLTTGTFTKGNERITKLGVYALLKVKERKFREFWNEVKSAGIFTEEDETGYIKLNDSIFYKGSLENIDVSKKTIRIYANAVRHLYDISAAREHKVLAYVFQAIPYVNVKYNIICRNSEEYDLKHIRCLCLTDYCRLIGYAPEHVTRLKKALKRLEIMGEGVFGFTETAAGDSIFVNPRIYYGGNDYEEVKVLGKFFEGGNDN